MARPVSLAGALLSVTLLMAGAAGAQDKKEVGEPIAADSPDMLRHAQSEATPAQVMAQRLGLGGPLNIESNWSRFDADGDESLSPLEFGMWIMETNGQDIDDAVRSDLRGRASGNAAVEMLNTTAATLGQVDADGDWRVSREELSLIAE